MNQDIKPTKYTYRVRRDCLLPGWVHAIPNDVVELYPNDIWTRKLEEYDFIVKITTPDKLSLATANSMLQELLCDNSISDVDKTIAVKKACLEIQTRKKR